MWKCEDGLVRKVSRIKWCRESWGMGENFYKLPKGNKNPIPGFKNFTKSFGIRQTEVGVGGDKRM